MVIFKIAQPENRFSTGRTHRVKRKGPDYPARSHLMALAVTALALKALAVEQAPQVFEQAQKVLVWEQPAFALAQVQDFGLLAFAGAATDRAHWCPPRQASNRSVVLLVSPLAAIERQAPPDQSQTVANGFVLPGQTKAGS
jgi:hypothetical protein